MKNLGFIGFGNMANAIANGINKSKIIPSKNILVYDVFEKAMINAQNNHFSLAKDEIDIVNRCEVIFLCVKPQNFTELLLKIQPFSDNKTYTSIAAGVTINAIQSVLNNAAVIRAMPNTPLMLGRGTTALCKSKNTSEEVFKFVKNVFESVGTIYEIAEDKFNEIINVNGSTPAYFYFIAKIIAEFAKESGLDYDISLQMICDTMVGSAEMLKHSGKSAQELIDMVSSKGGTTVAALTEFRSTGFEDALRAGMYACLKRADEISKI